MASLQELTPEQELQCWEDWRNTPEFTAQERLLAIYRQCNSILILCNRHCKLRHPHQCPLHGPLLTQLDYVNVYPIAKYHLEQLQLNDLPNAIAYQQQWMKDNNIQPK